MLSRDVGVRKPHLYRYGGKWGVFVIGHPIPFDMALAFAYVARVNGWLVRGTL